MRKKKKVAKKKLPWTYKHFFILVGSIIILLFFLGLLANKIDSFKSTPPETARNSMKKIPADVKETLALQTQQTSDATTLHIPILMYHYVEYVTDLRDTERQKLNIPPHIFEKQLQTLIAAGYTFMTAQELGDVLDGTMQLPKNPIILTFDDGHWDLDTSVLPILKKYHVKATAYIISGFVGTNSDSLTSSQLQDVINSGLVEIGAHTVHHLALKGHPLAKTKYEILASKISLEQKYNIHIVSFAYPYGSFDQQAIDLVKQSGFTTAVSTIAGNEQSKQNRFFLYRVRPGDNTGQQLLTYINRAWHL